MHTSRSQTRWSAQDMVEQQLSVVAMETVVVHLSVKLEQMADGSCMVQSVGEVEDVTQLKDIQSLLE